jgi:hypothetical protein
MLIQPGSGQNIAPRASRERKLWHNEKQNTPSMGCELCPQKSTCGGLRLEQKLYDCLGFCCGKPSDCDRVCRNRPEAFTRAVREINGFELDNVPRAAVLPRPRMTSVVPVLYHGAKRATPFRASSVCLPLYDIIARHNGGERYDTRAALAEKYGIREDATIILTGTDVDAPLERWWSLSGKRVDAIRALKGLGITLVTSPNYSLFTDQPRWDDMHSMKRIAIAQEEFAREGLPAALHVNARTDKDWQRWTSYIAGRPEITHIAFEFATGAGWGTRTAWHVDQLVNMARSVGRPLHLIMRGGSKVIPALVGAFDECTFLETTVFMKTEYRQRAVALPTGKIKWHRNPTKTDEPIDALLNENWKVVGAFYADLLAKTTQANRAA